MCRVQCWFLFAMIGSRRIHLPVAIVSIGRAGTTARKLVMEKEGQEQEEGNIKKWKRAQGSAQSALPREEHKEKRPLTRGRFVIVPSPTGTPAPVATPIAGCVVIVPGRHWWRCVGRSPRRHDNNGRSCSARCHSSVAVC